MSPLMELRISLADLSAAPGFLDPGADSARGLDAAQAAALYSFLPPDTSFALTGETLVITRPDPANKPATDPAELFERAAKRAREGDHEKAIQQFERALAIEPLHVTGRRDLAMSRMAKGDNLGADAELRRLLIRGVMSQLYNLPIDMIIERRIATQHPALRYAQVQSLVLLLEEAVKGSSAPDIVRIVPRRILHASRFLNACYAAFVDHQFAGALAASVPYIQMGAMERGLKLFRLWTEQTQNLTPGAEYDVVDKFAAELRLREWFRWQEDTGEAAPNQAMEGSSNPELLARKSPAAVFYFLEILKHLDRMDVETVQRVAADAALVGKGGLDYGSPDKSYRVAAYGDEMLSGLEVMCVMFAAFKRIAPEHDVSIELHDAYQKAHRLWKRGTLPHPRRRSIALDDTRNRQAPEYRNRRLSHHAP